MWRGAAVPGAPRAGAQPSTAASGYTCREAGSSADPETQSSFASRAWGGNVDGMWISVRGQDLASRGAVPV